MKFEISRGSSAVRAPSKGLLEGAVAPALEDDARCTAGGPDETEDGGSNPQPGIHFHWREKLGNADCPYLIRWVLSCAIGAIRLHHWIASDDQRHFHDHGWWFLVIILRGGYVDHSPNGDDRLRIGSIRIRPAIHRHTVELNPGGCWSLLLTGPEVRQWGFWVNGRFRKRNKYFHMFGHHPCEK